MVIITALHIPHTTYYCYYTVYQITSFWLFPSCHDPVTAPHIINTSAIRGKYARNEKLDGSITYAPYHIHITDRQSYFSCGGVRPGSDTGIAAHGCGEDYRSDEPTHHRYDYSAHYEYHHSCFIVTYIL